MSLEFRWLPHATISTTIDAFRVRRRYPAGLSATIAEHGVRTPLLVAPSADGTQLVSGWGRYQFASPEKPLPCFVLPAGLSTGDLWDEFLRDNDRWNVVEAARVLQQLSEVPDLTPERIVREKMPLLGLRPANELFQGHLRLLDLPPEVQEFIETEDLPLRRARIFFKLSPEALPAFIQFASRLRLTLNEIAETLELLAEISERDQKNPAILLQALAAEEKSGKDAVLQQLREQRFPELSRYRRKLEELGRQINFTVPVRIDWDSRLERPGIRLVADLEDVEALETFGRELSAQRETIERFFEIL